METNRQTCIHCKESKSEEEFKKSRVHGLRIDICKDCSITGKKNKADSAYGSRKKYYKNVESDGSWMSGCGSWAHL